MRNTIRNHRRLKRTGSCLTRGAASTSFFLRRAFFLSSLAVFVSRWSLPSDALSTSPWLCSPPIQLCPTTATKAIHTNDRLQPTVPQQREKSSQGAYSLLGRGLEGHDLLLALLQLRRLLVARHVQRALLHRLLVRKQTQEFVEIEAFHGPRLRQGNSNNRQMNSLALGARQRPSPPPASAAAPPARSSASPGPSQRRRSHRPPCPSLSKVKRHRTAEQDMMSHNVLDSD